LQKNSNISATGSSAVSVRSVLMLPSQIPEYEYKRKIKQQINQKIFLTRFWRN